MAANNFFQCMTKRFVCLFACLNLCWDLIAFLFHFKLDINVINYVKMTSGHTDWHCKCLKIINLLFCIIYWPKIIKTNFKICTQFITCISFVCLFIAFVWNLKKTQVEKGKKNHSIFLFVCHKWRLNFLQKKKKPKSQ